MPARIYRFPRPYRRRPVPAAAPVRPARHRGRYVHADGFAAMLSATLVSAFFYLSGAGGLARHDARYAVLLALCWFLYFFHPRLLRVRVLGPLLAAGGRLLLFAGVFGFFGGIFWLIFRNG